ncbi:MAG: phosphoribosylanthranilate isomerase [Deltaproteobacteria bacterium]|nr:phosphoribosylanthranilate isomerase [Deltaproteobacteria bacterium]
MKIKVCGITRLEDAQLASELGAWALGFIFHRKSPRYIEPAQAGKIVAALNSRVRFAGVFVNATLEEIENTQKISGIDLVQLHGDETPEFCASVRTEMLKAVRPRSQADIDALSAFRSVRTFLIDAAVEGEYGGTGQVANWKLASAALQHGEVFLSGGLNAGNVTEALYSVQPSGLDVSSGVEKSPGIKDAVKLRLFFENIRGCK